MKKISKILFVIICLSGMQLSNNLNADSLQGIESKERWKGLGLCVWPGEGCIKSVLR